LQSFLLCWSSQRSDFCLADDFRLLLGPQTSELGATAGHLGVIDEVDVYFRNIIRLHVRAPNTVNPLNFSFSVRLVFLLAQLYIYIPLKRILVAA